MTNADKIRNMTDEELAEFIVRNQCTICLKGSYDCFAWDNCVYRRKKWLENEVDE